MTVIALVAICAFIIAAALALARWWTRTHSKSKEDQARAIVSARSAMLERGTRVTDEPLPGSMPPPGGGESPR
jgi:hypothetical protein